MWTSETAIIQALRYTYHAGKFEHKMPVLILCLFNNNYYTLEHNAYLATQHVASNNKDGIEWLFIFNPWEYFNPE